MKKILCPTDFSDTANNAIAYAAKLSQATGAMLTLFNVQSLYDVLPEKLVKGEDQRFELAREQLTKLSIEISRIFKISCYAAVEHGYTKLSKAIDNKAKDYNLVVMGTNGPDDLYQFFMGTNAYKAILKTETPILLIPSDCGYSKIKSIAYSFDYLKERDVPLLALIPILKDLQSELIIVQVIEEAYSSRAEEDLKELQFIIKSKHRQDVNFRYDTIRSSDVATSINCYMLRNQVDALALCSIHQGLLGRIFRKSVIKNISVIANYPVFVFQP